MYLEGNRHWVPLVCDYSSHYCLITAVKGMVFKQFTLGKGI